MLRKLIAALFFVALATPVYAETPAFEAVDADKDGSISQEEAMAAGMQEDLFTQLDVNKDSMLDKMEYEVMLKQNG